MILRTHTQEFKESGTDGGRKQQTYTRKRAEPSRRMGRQVRVRLDLNLCLIFQETEPTRSGSRAVVFGNNEVLR